MECSGYRAIFSAIRVTPVFPTALLRREMSKLRTIVLLISTLTILIVKSLKNNRVTGLHIVYNTHVYNTHSLRDNYRELTLGMESMGSFIKLYDNVMDITALSTTYSMNQGKFRHFYNSVRGTVRGR